MAANPSGSWPDALQHIEKPDSSDPFDSFESIESIQPASKAAQHISGHGHHHAEIDEGLPKRKGTVERIAILPPEILEQ